MRKFLLIIPLFLIFSGCSEKGGFADQAKIVKAQSTMVKLRNALEEYRFDKGAYPGPNSDWLKLISPYFTRENPVESEQITNTKILLLESENIVTQISGVLGEMRRKALFADSSLSADIFKILAPIDSILNKMRLEVGKGKPQEYPDLSIYLSRLDTLLGKIDVEEKMDEYLTAMETAKEHLHNRIYDGRHLIDSLGLMDETLQGYFNDLDRAVDQFYTLAKGEDKTLKFEDIPNTDNLIDGIVSRLDKKNKKEKENLESLRDEITNYKRYLLNIEFLDYSKQFQKKIPIIKQLAKRYREKLRDQTIHAKTIMHAYDALDKCRVFINLYKSEKGELPTGDLRHLFEDPEKEDEFDLVMKHLSSDPILELTEDGYVIKAKDTEGTEVVFQVRFINRLDEMLKESFSWGPVYQTIDSTKTFFVKARAKDSFKTLVTTRPEFIQVKKKKEAKK
ncbi:hypothetical protein J7J69_00230 [candidate division WOR-3 bacterium]|nr:hypothetical protein [candidate division WOR-3 bacterium]